MIFIFYNPPGPLKQDNRLVRCRGDHPAVATHSRGPQMDQMTSTAQATSLTNERQLRIDLAAAFRIVARLGMHEAVANHFSVAVSPDGRKFLMHPKWRT